MREFMNIVCNRLVEHRTLLEGHGVDPRNVILRTCVSMFSGKYWDRRPHAKDYGNENAFHFYNDHMDELPEEMQDVDDEDEILETPEFKWLVLRWAKARYRNVEQKLSELPMGSRGVKVARMLKVDLTKFDTARQTGHTDLGVHWTYDPDTWHMHSVWGFNNGVDITVYAEIPLNSIDWFNTYMANMDYLSGDEEYELRVHPGEEVFVSRIEDEDGNELDISGIRFTA